MPIPMLIPIPIPMPPWNNNPAHTQTPINGVNRAVHSQPQLQPQPRHIPPTPASALRPPHDYPKSRGPPIPSVVDTRGFPSLPGKAYLLGKGKSKAVAIINPRSGEAQSSEPRGYPTGDDYGPLIDTCLNGKNVPRSGTQPNTTALDIYARPYVQRVVSIINELGGHEIHTLGIKEINLNVYSGRCLPWGFLPAVPEPITPPETAPSPLADGDMHQNYEKYFQYHLEAELRSQKEENDSYALFEHPVTDFSHSAQGSITCSFMVPGLRENSPYVEEDDIIQLRELIYEDPRNLLGMKNWITPLKEIYDSGQRPLPFPFPGGRGRGERAPGWTNFIYNGRVLALQRKKNILIVRIDGSPDAQRWCDWISAPPSSLRFNIQFPVSMKRYQAMKKALPIVQGALRIAKNQPQFAYTTALNSPNTPWLQSMLFPLEADSPTQTKLNSGNFKQAFFDAQLNWEQKKAIESICLGNYGTLPFLISGPPGTGKTKTLIEVALQIVKNSKGVSNVLFCAPSDSAADMIIQRISSHFRGSDSKKLLRLNPSSRPFAEVPGAVLLYCCITNDKFDLPMYEQLMACKLVVTTCRDASILLQSRVSNADLFASQNNQFRANNPNLTPPIFNLRWTALIIDEAAQAMEPEALIPLSVVAPPLDSANFTSNPLVVMAGDQHQLGPRTSLPSSPLKTSLFARLFARSVYAHHPLSRGKSGERAPRILTRAMLPMKRQSFTNLVLNYRSHPAILAVPSSLFYFDTLEPEATKTDCLSSWSGWRGRKWPVLFHDSNCEDHSDNIDSTGGWSNAGEAKVACAYAASLVSSGLVQQKDVCIMSPFKAQVALLRRTIREHGTLWDVDIGPTEAFQGLERSVVILCTTRTKADKLESDKKSNWGIINQPNAMNVAMTRAKFGLIVIGKKEVLLLDPCWKAFLEFCGRNGLVDGLERGNEQDTEDKGLTSTRLEKVLLRREEDGEMIEEELVGEHGSGDLNGTERAKVRRKVLKVFPQEDDMWIQGMQATLDAGPGSEDDEYEYEDGYGSQGSHDGEYQYEHNGSIQEGGAEGWCS